MTSRFWSASKNGLWGHFPTSTAALTSVPVTIFLGQSWAVWARDNVNELPSTPANDGNAKIWVTGSQTIAPLVYGPRGTGGNEQQPTSVWTDATYPSGIGWLPAYFQETRVNDASTTHYVFGYAYGGAVYADTGPGGRDSNWDPTATGSAYQDMLVEWNAFKAALTLIGKTPSVYLVYCDLGISTGYDSTQSSAFQTAHTAMIAQLRTDVIGTARVIQLRRSNRLTGSFGATVRTAQQNMATADPTKFTLINTDGVQLLQDIPTIADDHPGAASLESFGRRLALEKQSIAYPLQNISEMGSAIYPLRVWRPAGTEATLVSGNVSRAWENANGTAHLSQATATNQPAATTRTLSNGLVQRFAVFDGVNDGLKGSSPAGMGNSGGFVFMAAVKMAAGASKAIYGEGNSALGNPFLIIQSQDVSGNLGVVARNNAGTIVNASLGVVAFDNTWRMVVVYFNGTTFTGWVDGTTGSAPLSFTPGTMTLDSASIGAANTDSGLFSFGAASIGEVVIAQYNSSALSAHLTAQRAYFQREHGTT